MCMKMIWQIFKCLVTSIIGNKQPSRFGGIGFIIWAFYPTWKTE
jgi:hypothetical protein